MYTDSQGVRTGQSIDPIRAPPGTSQIAPSPSHTPASPEPLALPLPTATPSGFSAA
jgi:hypothetical protein